MRPPYAGKPSINEADELLNSNLDEVNSLQSLSDNLIKLTQYQRNGQLLNFEKVSLVEVIKEAEKKLAKGEFQLPDIRIAAWYKGFLNRLRVAYRWGEEITQDSDDDSFAPAIRRAVPVVAELLDPLVNQEYVDRIWANIKSSPQKLEVYLREEFRFKIVLAKPPLAYPKLFG